MLSTILYGGPYGLNQCPYLEVIGTVSNQFAISFSAPPLGFVSAELPKLPELLPIAYGIGTRRGFKSDLGTVPDLIYLIKKRRKI